MGVTTYQATAEVIDRYLRAREQWALRTADTLQASKALFEEAIQLDSNYAPAFAGLADTYCLMVAYGVSMAAYGVTSRAQAYQLASDHAQQALTLNPMLAQAYASLGFVQKAKRQWANAEDSFKTAVGLNPDYPVAHHWYSILLTQLRRFPEALAEIDAAIRIGGPSLGTEAQRAAVLVMSGNYSAAVERLEPLVSANPGFGVGYRFLAQAYTHLGEFQKAEDNLLIKAVGPGHIPAGDRELLEDLGYLYAKWPGHAGQAQARAMELAGRYSTEKEVANNVATIYAGLPNFEQALFWLNRADADNDADLGYLNADPKWNGARVDSGISNKLTQIMTTPIQ
jgi:tetratricopeptide (TPR) repeat protein